MTVPGPLCCGSRSLELQAVVYGVMKIFENFLKNNRLLGGPA